MCNTDKTVGLYSLWFSGGGRFKQLIKLVFTSIFPHNTNASPNYFLFLLIIIIFFIYVIFSNTTDDDYKRVVKTSCFVLKRCLYFCVRQEIVILNNCAKPRKLKFPKKCVVYPLVKYVLLSNCQFSCIPEKGGCMKYTSFLRICRLYNYRLRSHNYITLLVKF